MTDHGRRGRGRGRTLSEMKKPRHKYRNRQESNGRTGCVCGCAVVAVVCFVFSGVVGVDSVVVGMGGQVDGDPAPGRSPGPPRGLGKYAHAIYRRQERSVSDVFPNVVMEESAPLEAPWCEDYTNSVQFSPGSTTDIMLNLSHALFTTEDGIVPGVSYEGKLYSCTGYELFD